MFDLENNQTIWLIVGGILVLTVIFVAFMVKNSGNDGGISGGRTIDVSIDSEDWKKGADTPKITLVEYGDFQCPACKAYQPLLSQLIQKVDGLQLVFRHLPLTQTHQNAMDAAKAAEAAGRQGKFWAMHDKLFEKQKEWKSLSDPKSKFVSYAEEIGLEIAQFKQDYESKEVDESIRKDMRTARKFNLRGTPSFIVGGQVLDRPPRNLNEFVNVVEKAKNNQDLSVTSSKKQVHKHADIAIFINGRQIDLSKKKYQSNEENHKHKYSHHHDQVGDIIHQHKSEVPLSEHFESLGMRLTDKCFQLDNGAEYCTNENNSLKMYVNGERVTNYSDFVFDDLDRILISYGPKTGPNIKEQLKQVTDKACIYSGKCPERGEPPSESCVGGLGTKCKGDSGSTSTKK